MLSPRSRDLGQGSPGTHSLTSIQEHQGSQDQERSCLPHKLIQHTPKGGAHCEEDGAGLVPGRDCRPPLDQNPLLCASPCVLSRVRLFATPWTVARQAPLSVGFPRQEHWSGLPFPTPGDLPDPESKPSSPASPASAGRFFTANIPWEAPLLSSRQYVKGPPYILFRSVKPPWRLL